MNLTGLDMCPNHGVLLSIIGTKVQFVYDELKKML